MQRTSELRLLTWLGYALVIGVLADITTTYIILAGYGWNLMKEDIIFLRFLITYFGPFWAAVIKVILGGSAFILRWTIRDFYRENYPDARVWEIFGITLLLFLSILHFSAATTNLMVRIL